MSECITAQEGTCLNGGRNSFDLSEPCVARSVPSTNVLVRIKSESVEKWRDNECVATPLMIRLADV